MHDASKLQPRANKMISTCKKVILLLFTALVCTPALGQINNVLACDNAGIGAAKLTADAPVIITSVSIESISSGGSAIPYCLVKVLVPQAINIWVGLPMNGKWNGRLQSEGNGGYAGMIMVPTQSLADGYVGVRTDTGHSTKPQEDLYGDFAMLKPGVPNMELQKDFAYRSQHLMAVIAKQLIKQFYGQEQRYSYWNGCSEGGREGLRMAQDFPGDYDGILAGAPAINLDRLPAAQLWPQVVMKDIAGGAISLAKEKLASDSAMAACDAIDGVSDGIITDTSACKYSAVADKSITRASCTATDNTCLRPQEAEAIDRIWQGPTNLAGKSLWPGVERGASLGWISGEKPIVFAVNQPRFWIYLDPTWDWHRVTLANYEEFFEKSMQTLRPMVGSDNPDLSAFRARGGKIITWHGSFDGGIMPGGSLLYYNSVVKFFGKGHSDVQQFYRLFFAPGVEHCAGGNAPQPEKLFQAVIDWVEQGRAPDHISSSQSLAGGAVRTRPMCPYPAFAKYSGHGSTDDANNFKCVAQ
jgi:hypothetical protein